MAQDDDVGLLGVDTSLTRTASKYDEVRNPERGGFVTALMQLLES